MTTKNVTVSLSVEEAQAVAAAIAEGFAQAHSVFARRGKYKLAAAMTTGYKAIKRAEAEALALATGK